MPYDINRGGISKDNYIGKGIRDLYSTTTTTIVAPRRLG